MRGERLDIHYNFTLPPKSAKEIERERIAAEIAAFLAGKKNKIIEVPIGASAFDGKTKNQIINKLSQKSKAKPASRVWNDARGKK